MRSLRQRLAFRHGKRLWWAPGTFNLGAPPVSSAADTSPRSRGPNGAALAASDDVVQSAMRDIGGLECHHVDPAAVGERRHAGEAEHHEPTEYTDHYDSHRPHRPLRNPARRSRTSTCRNERYARSAPGLPRRPDPRDDIPDHAVIIM
jgi:hypothetical protein